VCPRQIPRGYEELVDNLPTRENKRLFEKLSPLIPGERMILVQPAPERTIFLLQFKNSLRVDDCSIDLETISDNTRVCKQPGAILFAIVRHSGNIEPIIRIVEVICLFQNGDP
jgi:hypothetical protein